MLAVVARIGNKAPTTLLRVGHLGIVPAAPNFAASQGHSIQVMGLISDNEAMATSSRVPVGRRYALSQKSRIGSNVPTYVARKRPY